MFGDGFFFSLLASLKGQNENMAVIDDPTLYLIQTSSNSYTGKIAFQNEKFMKLCLTSDKPKVVKILKENIRKVEIIRHS